MLTNKKRNISIICAVALSASLIITGTLAYFIDKEKVTNPFSMSGSDPEGKTGVDIDLDEPGYDEDTSKNMYPGDTIVKDPTITNIKEEVYARLIVKVVESGTETLITDTDRLSLIMSTLYYDANYVSGTNPVISAGTPYSNTILAGLVSSGKGLAAPINPEFVVDSTRTGGGVYYYNYNGILASEAEKTLFTHAVIPTDWSKAQLDQAGNFDIIVEAQAIQTKNLVDAAEAFTALDGDLAKE